MRIQMYKGTSFVIGVFFLQKKNKKNYHDYIHQLFTKVSVDGINLTIKLSFSLDTCEHEKSTTTKQKYIKTGKVV